MCNCHSCEKQQRGSNRMLNEPEIRRTPKEMTGTARKVQPANQEQQLKMEGVLHIPQLVGELQRVCGGLNGMEYSGATNSKLAHLKLPFRAKPCTEEKQLGTETKLSVKETREGKDEGGPDKQLGRIKGPGKV